MDDGRLLLNAVLAHPDEDTPRLVYADWLDENGRAALAFAYRWAVRRGRKPVLSPTGRTATWTTHRRGQHEPAWPSQLPPVVFAQLRPLARVRVRSYAPPAFSCRGGAAAFAHLADALARLREVLD